MGLAVLVHLEAMFDVAPEPVGVGKTRGIGGRKEAVLGELGEGGEGGGGLEERLASGIEQLEGLGDELDVADASATAFDVAMGVALDGLGFESGLGGGDFFEEAFAEGPGVAKRLDRLEEFRAELAIAGDRAGLEEHEAFPRLAPFGVVGFVAVERAGERSGVPLRAEAQVDAVELAVGGDPGDLGPEVFRKAPEELVVGHRARPGFGARGGRVAEHGAFVAVDEEEVDVRAEVQFLSAELAECEDAKGGGYPGTFLRPLPGFAVAGRQLGTDDPVDAGETDVGQVREFAGDAFDQIDPGEVPCRDSEGFPFPEPAQGGEGCGVIGAADGLVEEGGGLESEALSPAGMGDGVRFEAGRGPGGFAQQERRQVTGPAGDADEGAGRIGADRRDEAGRIRVMTQFLHDAAGAVGIHGEVPESIPDGGGHGRSRRDRLVRRGREPRNPVRMECPVGIPALPFPGTGSCLYSARHACRDHCFAEPRLRRRPDPRGECRYLARRDRGRHHAAVGRFVYGPRPGRVVPDRAEGCGCAGVDCGGACGRGGRGREDGVGDAALLLRS